MSIPSFNSIYLARRWIALWEHGVNTRVFHISPARSIDMLRERLEGDLTRWSTDSRGVFKGRRYGAGRRMMADLNRGRMKLARKGRG